MKLQYFRSQSCEKCREFGPVLKEFISKYPDIEVQVVCVDDPSTLELRNQLGVKTAPTTIIYSEGIEVYRCKGAQNMEYLDTLAELWAE